MDTMKNSKGIEKTRIQNKISWQEISLSAPPFDLSFMKIKNIKDLQVKVPRKLRVGCPSKAENGKILTRAIWLNNNNISNLTGIAELTQHFQLVEWLDLSYNQIKNISDEISELQHLKILYLHENHIQYLFQVAKLTVLPYLQALTLYGNPIEYLPSYRKHIVHILPKLRKLDYSVVTSNDKSTIF